MNRKLKKAVARIERSYGKNYPNNGCGLLRFPANVAVRFDWYDAAHTARHLSRETRLSIAPNSIFNLFRTFQSDRETLL